MSTITTISGIHFDPVHPRDDQIVLSDIAHALSLLCRGNGHTRFFYSVAQHSIACALEALERACEPAVCLGCLLHDAAEAYLSDVTRPVKKDLPYYLEVEERLLGCIIRHFLSRDLTKAEWEMVTEIDDLMLSMEFHQLMAEDLGDDYRKLHRVFTCTQEDPRIVEEQFVSLCETLSASSG